MISSTSNKRGFTLVEMLAVIVIMALVIVAAIPAMKSGNAVSTAARQLSNAMMLARQYAINSRTAVRLTLATDVTVTNITGVAGSGSNLVCRGYAVYYASNDVNNNVVSWWPAQDWRPLPTGVVIEQNNKSTYDTIGSAPSLSGGPTGARSLTTYYGATSTNMQVIQNLANNTQMVFMTSFIEFRPTGVAAGVQPASGVGAIRLVQGTVKDYLSRDIIISDTKNWAIIEYDDRSGRIRTRFPESYP